ncbi:hypothetical protein GCM10017600_67470 [Streptosporangium carneum]|uniref:Uncharacterized protein n=1 Tax=Streptosporangium carneum TaxID=47481 RepID=A0A9W6I771_9ACTN|nr:hypothetical protein GCM10017600_67470 [Streptosporangium carneum]
MSPDNRDLPPARRSGFPGCCQRRKVPVDEESKHTIAGLAFYVGRPNATTAMTRLKKIIEEGS